MEGTSVFHNVDGRRATTGGSEFAYPNGDEAEETRYMPTNAGFTRKRQAIRKQRSVKHCFYSFFGEFYLIRKRPLSLS